MGFLDKLREAGEAAQRTAQQLGVPQSTGGQGTPAVQPDQPPDTSSIAKQADDSAAPPFGQPQSVPQGFRLERALTGSVTTADAAWRKWPGSEWASDYPNLGSDRFQCVLTIPAGAAGQSPLELKLTLDPFRPNGGYRTPGFGNAVELREVQTGRRWIADEQARSRGPIVVNPDGVSGSFRHFILRQPGQPGDRSTFVILDGDWRVGA